MKHYWQYYGMEKDPFSQTAGQASCYLSLQWQQYLDFLTDLNNYRHALIILTGIPGVGKTRLLHEIITKLPQNVHHLLFHARDCHGAEQLLQMLHENFGAPVEQDINLNLYDKANQQLTYLQHTNQRYLLLIDHADALPLDVRQILLHFVQQQLSGDVALQVILIGDAKFVEEMQYLANQQRPEDNEHIVNNLELDPFTYEETAAYLQHRFQEAGIPDAEQSPLTPEDIHTIYAQSEGIAKKINTLTESLLRGHIMEHDNQQQPQETQAPLFKRYIWWICTIAVIVVLLIWVLPMFQAKTNEVKPMSLPVQNEQAQNDELQAEQQNPQPSTQQQNPNPDYTQDGNNHSANLSNPAQNPPVAQPAAASPAPAQPQPVAPPAQSEATPGQSAATSVAAAPAIQPVTPPHAETATKVAPKHIVTKHTTHSIKVHATKNKLTPVEQQLLKINPNSYTLQLLGSYNKADILAFMKQHKLQSEAVYFHTYFNGKDWYVLISGDYATVAQAKAARAKLSPGLRKLNPWIRSFASVHKAIKMKH